MIELVPYRDLGGRPYPELCVVGRRFRGHGLQAFACSYPYLSWPARTITSGRRLAHRLALYDERDRLVGVFDHARFPIHDVAFHPSAPLIAIATGSYDGGYAFEGELWLWSYRTREHGSLLDATREVTRCRWDADGRLAILARPETDEDETTRFYGGRFDVTERAIATAGLVPCTAEDLGFGEREPEEVPREVRSLIWDLAWTLDGRLAVARDDGALELWSTAGRLEHTVPLTGRVVQLLRQPDRLLVHVITSCSRLYAIAGNEVELWRELPSIHSCSVDVTGRILARDTAFRGPRHDLVLSADNEVLLDGDLGHYDPFNHHLRIDGAPGLYALRGDPPGQHRHKQLWAIEPAARDAQLRWPWDVGDHRMSNAAVILEGDLVCCNRAHDPRGTGSIWIERRASQDGSSRWRHQVAGEAVALIAWPAVGGVVAALLDGTLCILDAAGRLLHHEVFEIDGVSTQPTALAVDGETLAIGTIDARISLRSLR